MTKLTASQKKYLARLAAGETGFAADARMRDALERNGLIRTVKIDGRFQEQLTEAGLAATL